MNSVHNITSLNSYFTDRKKMFSNVETFETFPPVNIPEKCNLRVRS